MNRAHAQADVGKRSVDVQIGYSVSAREGQAVERTELLNHAQKRHLIPVGLHREVRHTPLGNEGTEKDQAEAMSYLAHPTTLGRFHQSD